MLSLGVFVQLKTIHPQFMQLLNENPPNLSDTEVEICILLKCGVTKKCLNSKLYYRLYQH